MAKMIVKKFTSSGSWTAPAGVTRVQVRMWGGGMGGGGGFSTNEYNTSAAYSSLPYIFNLDVTPNTSYTITLGAGGTGGAIDDTGTGGDGGNTTFGALATALGAQFGANITAGDAFFAQGWNSTADGTAAAGALGGASGSYGPGGVGGAGGNASEAGTASAGTAAAANSGAGGGCGGNSYTGTAGAGAAGGSGYCEVMWVE